MKTFILFFIIADITLAQSFQPKQITFFDFDCGNPVFLKYPLNFPNWGSDAEIFFEAHSGNSVNIYALNYNAAADSFYEAVSITNDNFINRNPAGYLYYEYPDEVKIVVWETNKNGNWDIAFSTNTGSGWSEPGILIATEVDETNPSFLNDLYWPESVRILFERANSIYLYTKNQDSSFISSIFQATEDAKYKNPTGTEYWNYPFIAAVEENSQQSKLIYTDQPDHRIKTLYSLYPVKNPKFVDLYFNPVSISFEIEINGKTRAVIVEENNFGLNSGEILVDNDTTIESSNFNAYTVGIVTESPNIMHIPAVYKILRNDSTYIVANESNYYSYKEIFAKVRNPSPNIGPLGFAPNSYIVSYSIWEDSTDSNINLFGLKRLDPFGDVNEEGVINDFTLSQNYPNPFNPSTRIQYAVSSRQFVTLKVYDVLGREVATLINEEKQPGVYEVEFQSSVGSRQLATGVYYYQLRAGSYIETKKMIYLK